MALSGSTADEVAKCEHAGRATPPTSHVPALRRRRAPTRDVDAFIAEMRPYDELGIRTVIVMPINDQPLTFAQRLGRDVIPRAADLSV